MNRHSVSVLWMGIVAALFVSSAVLTLDSASAKNMYAKPATQAAMSEFLIESPHTPEECLGALDAISGQGPKALARWNFGCAWGEHVGWAIVKAPNEQAALAMVPAGLRDKAKIHQVAPFTAGQIKKLHEQH